VNSNGVHAFSRCVICELAHLVHTDLLQLKIKFCKANKSAFIALHKQKLFFLAKVKVKLFLRLINRQRCEADH
jgi:hypothetical protein